MKDFTKGSIPRLMIAFLVPLLLTNVLQALYLLVDAIWAGRLLGATGVAIVATGMPVIFLLSSLIAGIAVGSSILAGQAFGSGSRETLSDIISTAAIEMVAVSLLLSAFGVIFSGPLLNLINTPAPLKHGAHIFLAIIIGGMTLNALVQWFAAIMNATGNSRTPFNILLLSLLINVVLAPILITGAGVFPPLGIAGSGLSTIFSNLAAVIACFYTWRNHHLSEVAPFRFRLHWETMRKIIALGFPLSLQMLIVSSSFLFILSLVNSFGTNVTAAFGIGSRVDQFAFLALFAVTAAISAMTAQNVGAGRFDRIPRIAQWGVLLSFSIALSFFVVVEFFPDPVTALFTRDEAVIIITRHYFRIVGFSYLAVGLLFAYQGVLRGAGDTLSSFLIVASSMVFLRVPLCYYLSHFTRLNERGLWSGITISSSTGAVAFFLYYLSGKWKKRGTRITREPSASENVFSSNVIQTEECVSD